MNPLRKILGLPAIRGNNKPRTGSPTELIDKMDSSVSLRCFILFAVWLASAAAIVMPFKNRTEILIKNQRAPSSIFADCDFSYTDDRMTEMARRQAEEGEPAIFRIDAQISESVIARLRDAFENEKTRKDNPPEQDGNQPAPGSQTPPLQSDEALELFLKETGSVLDDGVVNASEKELRKGERLRIMDDKQRLRKSVLRIESVPSPSEAAEEAALRISQKYSPENRSRVQNAAAMLLGRIMTGNLVYDEEETLRRRRGAAEQVGPVRIDIRKGEMLMEKDKVVDESTLRKYEAYVAEKERLLGMRRFWRQTIVGSLLAAILLALAGTYMFHIHPDVVRSNKQIGMIASVAVINIALNTASLRLFSTLSPVHNLPPEIAATMLPLAVSSVILSVLAGLRVALYTGLFVSLVTAIQMDNSFFVVLNGMIISVVSGFAVRFAKNYRDYFIKCLLAVAITMPAMDLLRMAGMGRPPDMMLKSMAAGLAGGVFIAILCIGLLFFVETVFRAYSNMSLLGFCDYNHPLLKMMQMEAPGTYHHSLLVSTLAEQAAREIGANPIQARVGALFHDIGKIFKPEYFTENNLDGHNMHEDLSPRMSSIVILNHVKEGVELALKHKLPKIVRECIEQHHGKDMISFFFKRAVDSSNDGGDSVHEWDYRYPGPLPRSKETAIVALADSAEAASRSLEKPTPSKIDAIVWEIMRNKIRDGQLDDADITMRELATIRKSFTKTITTMMHGRISYPKDNKQDEETDLFQGALHKDTRQTQ